MIIIVKNGKVTIKGSGSFLDQLHDLDCAISELQRCAIRMERVSGKALCENPEYARTIEKLQSENKALTRTVQTAEKQLKRTQNVQK